MQKQAFIRALLIALVVISIVPLRIVRSDAAATDKLAGNAHLERALQFQAKNDINSAVIELKNALRANSEDGAARLMLGELYVERGEGAAAEKELLHAQRLGIDTRRLITLLSQARLLQRKYREVLDQTRIVEEYSPSLRAAVHVLRGKSYRGLRNYPAAREAFEAALKIDANLLEARIALGRIALAQGELERSDEFLSQTKQLAPNDPDVLAFAGDVAFARRDYSGSESAFARAIESLPQSPSLLIRLARAQLLRGKPKEALIHLENVLQINNRIAIAYFLRSLATFELRRYKQAETYAGEALILAPQYAPSRFIRGAARFAQGNYKGAHDELELFVETAPDHTLAQKILAKSKLYLGKAEEAFSAAKELSESAPEDEALLNLAGLSAIQTGDFITGRAYLEAVVRGDPENVAARARLGWARFALGDFEAGLKDLERAVEASPAMPYTEFRIIRQYVLENRFEDALLATRRYQRRNSKDSTGIVLEAVILLAQGRRAAAAAILRESLAARPGDAQIGSFLASVALKGRRFNEAERVYRQLLEGNPGHAPTLLALSRLKRAAGDADGGKLWMGKARDALDAALRRNPDDVPAGLMRAEIALAERDLKTARPLIQAFEKSSLINPRVIALSAQLAIVDKRFDDAARVYQRLVNLTHSTKDVLRLAEAHWRAKRPDSAIATLSGWLKRLPGNPPIRSKLGEYFLQLRRWTDAERLYSPLVEQFPNHAAASNNLAWAHLQLGSLDKALEHVKHARELAPDDSSIRDTFNKVIAARRERPSPRETDPLTARVSERVAAVVAEFPQDKNSRFHIARTLLQTVKTMLDELLSDETAFAERPRAKALMDKLPTQLSE